MIKSIAMLGRTGINLCQSLGQAGLFLYYLLIRAPRLKRIIPIIIKQIYHVGVLSLSIVVLSAAFIGMVVALQGYNTLDKFSASAQLGQLLALTITRELGPVVTALLFAGRAGSALTAEIGLMKTTEQLSSMAMMGVDPLWRVIYPRFWASFVALPLLSFIFCVVSIVSGYVISVDWLGVDAGSFWNNMQVSVDFKIDVLNGVIKSIVFGFVVSWIAVFQGYTTVPTAQGMARATTRSVVYASLAVLALDFVLTTMMLGDW